MAPSAISRLPSENIDTAYFSEASPNVHPLFSLKDRTAIVSGAAAGIGLAVAAVLASAGANVALLYHNNSSAIETAKLLGKTWGVQCRAYKVDITIPSEVEVVVGQIVHEFNGRLDIFVANSGVPWLGGSVLDGSVEEYRRIMSTNLDGTYNCAVAAGRQWRRQAEEGTTIHGGHLVDFKRGSFIATSSVMAGIVGKPQMQAPYNVAKAGISHLCKSLAVEWAGFARVNSVSPGYTATEVMEHVPESMKDAWTDMTPMGRIGRPEEMTGAYLYLASDTSSFTTGADIVVDGGLCLT